jgi:uracil DNA glycosylase
MISYQTNKQTNTKLRRRSSVTAQYTAIRHLSLHSLLPETQHYMTYEGSTTHPGCWETTVWIILNRPIYITKQEVRSHPPRWSASRNQIAIITCLSAPTVPCIIMTHGQRTDKSAQFFPDRKLRILHSFAHPHPHYSAPL